MFTAATVVTFVLVFAYFVQAQQPAKIPRIGYVAGGASALPAAFVQGLRDVGYFDEKNLVINSVLPRASQGSAPIVMTGATDVVATAVVDSLARPGGNVTGLTSVTGQLGGKLIELLKEIIPRLSRVVVSGPPPAGSPSEVLFMKETDIPARAVKVQLIGFTVRGPEDYEDIFRETLEEQGPMHFWYA